MADTVVLGFNLNFETKFEIGEAGAVDASTGKITAPANVYEISAGIESAEPKNDEETKDYSYYKDKGGKDTSVTSVTSGYDFKGNRFYGGDDAQNFVRAKLNSTGTGRVVYFRVTEPNGDIRSGNATLSGITQGGGDASERNTFEFSLTFNGIPDDTVKFTPTTPTA